jgi:predicted MFS family arabinose efflux permease
VTNRWAVLALIMAAQVMANVGPLGIPSIAPLIREDLGLSVTQAGSFLSAYYIGPVLISLPAGWLADRWGVRGAMILGQALIAVGLFAAAVAPSFSFLVVILVLSGAAPGAGPGLLVPLAVGIGFFGVGWNGVQHTLMAELAGPRAAGTAVGLGLAISSLGVTVCPPVFGLVVERVGGYGFAWGTLAAGMMVALLLLIPVRERAMATS